MYVSVCIPGCAGLKKTFSNGVFGECYPFEREEIKIIYYARTLCICTLTYISTLGVYIKRLERWIRGQNTA